MHSLPLEKAASFRVLGVLTLGVRSGEDVENKAVVVGCKEEIRASTRPLKTACEKWDAFRFAV